MCVVLNTAKSFFTVESLTIKTLLFSLGSIPIKSFKKRQFYGKSLCDIIDPSCGPLNTAVVL